jgi:glycosyltransferase involved in cell wall biosynthesis
MNELSNYYLIQPWFYSPGHPATSLVRTYRAIRSFLPVKTIVYLPQNGNLSEHLKNCSAECHSIEISCSNWLEKSLGTLASGTWASVAYLARSNQNINLENLFFLDANLYILGLAILWFRIRPQRLNVLCMVGPEFFQRNQIDKIVKFTLVKKLFQYPFFFLFLRTPELAISWQKEFPDFTDRIDYLPSLELNDIESTSIALTSDRKFSSSPHPVFLVSGQIRPEKSIERLATIFAEEKFFAQLRIAGAIIDSQITEHLDRYQAHPNISVIDRFLNESEIAEEFERADYNVMLYDPWDDRMESAMLFMSLRYRLPVICYDTGWLGNQVEEQGLGWVLSKSKKENLKDFLQTVPRPNSSQYLQAIDNLQRCLTQYSSRENIELFLSKLAWQ